MTSCVARADERLRVFSHSLPYRDEKYCLPACTRLGQDPTDTKFRSSCRSPPRGHSRSIHPHYLSGHASTNHFEGVASITASRLLIVSLQPSILGLWLRATHAGVTPACHQNISSPHVQRFVMHASRSNSQAIWPRESLHTSVTDSNRFQTIRDMETFSLVGNEDVCRFWSDSLDLQ